MKKQKKKLFVCPPYDSVLGTNVVVTVAAQASFY